MTDYRKLLVAWIGCAAWMAVCALLLRGTVWLLFGPMPASGSRPLWARPLISLILIAIGYGTYAGMNAAFHRRHPGQSLAAWFVDLNKRAVGEK